MKVYNINDLQSALDDDIVWRRKELSTIITTIKTSDTASSRALIRAAIPLLYAHWEGFGKLCGVRYLEFVSYRSKRFRDLKPSFVYLSMIPHLKEIATAPPDLAMGALSKYSKKMNEVNRDPFKKRINTKSNLRFDALVEMLTICGINPVPFHGYKTFIDDEICDPRNEIAHGVGSAPTLQTLIRRRDRTFILMTHLQNEIVNAAATDAFLV